MVVPSKLIETSFIRQERFGKLSTGQFSALTSMNESSCKFHIRKRPSTLPLTIVFPSGLAARESTPPLLPKVAKYPWLSSSLEAPIRERTVASSSLILPVCKSQIAISPSSHPLNMYRPSVLNLIVEALMSLLELTPILRISLPSISHNLTVQSQLALAINLPSGLNAREDI